MAEKSRAAEGETIVTSWYLVLMIWGDRYSDADCNRLIRAAYAHSPTIKGAVVISDRTDRQLDPRAMQCLIPADFDRPENKTGGLAVKISMFDIAALPPGAPCVYVDLDSAIIGDLGRLADLTQYAPLWTLPTQRARFTALSRLRWRLSGGRRYGAGNSSLFAYRNGFAGNPAATYRDNTPIFGQIAGAALRQNDDHFIGWACQNVIRPLPRRLAVRFRMEFMEITLWLNRVKAALRRKARQDLVVVTFDGDLTKPAAIMALAEGDLIKDHHSRRTRWNDSQISGLRGKLLAALRG